MAIFIKKNGTLQRVEAFQKKNGTLNSANIWDTAIKQGYITFSSANTFTLSTVNNSKGWNGIIQYSTDALSWAEWDGTAAISSSQSGTTKYLYLRGIKNTKISGYSYSWQLTGSNIRCDGNIENLLDNRAVFLNRHPRMYSGCFSHLFNGCTALISAPELPSPAVGEYCYSNMFAGTSITAAPELPATQLMDICYESMFANCTSLTTPPSILPATYVEGGSYRDMFDGCTNLTTAPTILAELVGHQGMEAMFRNCTSLTVAPELHITDFIGFSEEYGSCCRQMFKGCTSLTTPPSILPVTDFGRDATYCYESMFEDCTSLTTIPELPATNLTGAPYCYQNMFKNCTNLTTLPVFSFTSTANGALIGMFDGCTKIKLSETKTGEYTKEYDINFSTAGVATNMFANTGGTFTGTPDANTTYYTSNTLIGNSYLTFSSSRTFTLSTVNNTKNWNSVLEYSTDKTEWSEWNGTSALSSSTDSGVKYLYLRGSNNTKISGYISPLASAGWTLTGIDIRCDGIIESLLDYKKVVNQESIVMADDCFYQLFKDNTTLVSAPTFTATSLSSDCYTSMFSGCSNLVDIPNVLPATTLARYCYAGMFYGCTSLITTPELPATVCSQACYRQMFKNCINLTNIARIHLSSTLSQSEFSESCREMFSGCSKIKLSATKTGEYAQTYNIPRVSGSGYSQYTDMFKNTGGTFTGTPSTNTTYYLSTANNLVESYLTFNSTSTFTLSTNNSTKNWDGTIEYSTDASTWNTWDGTATLNSTSSDTVKFLYLRGSNNTYLTGGTDGLAKRWILTGSDINCKGNIENLLDYQTVAENKHPITSGASFAYLFNDCTALISAPDLISSNDVTIVPTSYLVGDYAYMLQDCTNLTALPILSCINPEYGYYRSLFKGCTALATEKLNLLHVRELASSATLFDIGVAIRLGPNLVNISNPFADSLASTNPDPYEIYYEFDDSDTVLFDVENCVSSGSSKATLTYNIYTDNTSIKNAALAKVDNYTIVNVYHLDGTSW